MLFGIPCDQAVNMPLDFAVALLNDERLDNTHSKLSSNKTPNPPPNTSASNNEGTTFVAMGRKHSKPKG
ncbi:hypothetical protein [Acinetobacter seifertii]|uniref:hypothetical protein n=2 Tax=Acinetobacter calcoaceticus/baumannii complex TaxID=909768 RepID=UPI000E6AAF07|nr:hypothetical protein [Acinetobacter seifertii]